MNTQVYSYNGNDVSFHSGSNNILINATEMARPFNKTPKDYLRTQSSQDFINALSKRQNCPLADLVQVIKGGNNAGTWLHEDIALDFAQWLNIDFKLWCNDRLKELLKHGITATNSTIDNIINNPEFGIQLLESLKNERAEKERLKKQLKHNEVKINFVDRIIASDDMIDIGQCAKVLELPFGRNTLFKELREKGIFFKNKNEPKQAFIERGYFKLKEAFIETNTHGTISVIKVLVTQRGLGYLSTLFESAPSPKKLKKIT